MGPDPSHDSCVRWADQDLDNPNKSPSERALAAALDPHIAVLRAKSADEMHKYMYCGFRGSPDHLAAKCSARNM